MDQTKQQALELGPLGITCNALEPGFVVTGISKGYTDLMSPEEAAEFEAYWADKAPVGRVGSPSTSPMPRSSWRRIPPTSSMALASPSTAARVSGCRPLLVQMPQNRHAGDVAVGDTAQIMGQAEARVLELTLAGFAA